MCSGEVQKSGKLDGRVKCNGENYGVMGVLNRGSKETGRLEREQIECPLPQQDLPRQTTRCMMENVTGIMVSFAPAIHSWLSGASIWHFLTPTDYGRGPDAGAGPVFQPFPSDTKYFVDMAVPVQNLEALVAAAPPE